MRRPPCSGSPGELAGLTERAAADAERLLANARRALHRAQLRAEQLAAASGRDAAAGRCRERLRRAVNDLTDRVEAGHWAIGQGQRYVITRVRPDAGDADFRCTCTNAEGGSWTVHAPCDMPGQPVQPMAGGHS